MDYNESDRVPIGSPDLAPVWACDSCAVWPRPGPGLNFCMGLSARVLSRRWRQEIVANASKWDKIENKQL